MKKVIGKFKRMLEWQNEDNQAVILAYLSSKADEQKNVSYSIHIETLYKVKHKTFAKVSGDMLEVRASEGFEGFIPCTVHGAPSGRYMSVSMSCEGVPVHQILEAIDKSIDLVRS